jgi:hypothetical protein
MALYSLSDTVICVNNSRLPTDLLACPLVIGQEYDILGLKKCRCGKVFVDIGLALTVDKFDIVCRCKRRLNDGTWWFDGDRFERAVVKWEAVRAATAQLN